MPVRVKLEIKSRYSGTVLTVLALVNTGFVSNTLDLAIPVTIAERLGLWPRPSNALSASIETGGGVIESYIIPQAVIVKVITDDRCSKEVIANVVIDPYIDEVLISDALAEELGIQILFPKKGIWKFVNEDKIRYSVNPEEY